MGYKVKDVHYLLMVIAYKQNVAIY